jgi:hypothetical protein
MAGLAEAEEANTLDGDWEEGLEANVLGFMAETETCFLVVDIDDDMDDDDAIRGDDLLGVFWVVFGRFTGLRLGVLLVLVLMLEWVVLGRLADFVPPPSCSCFTRDTDFGVLN